MSGYTLADGTVPHAAGALKAHSHFLDVIEKQPNAEALIAARLAPDMLPYGFQVFVTADTTVKLVSRLQGIEPESVGSYDSIKTVADARAVLAKADAKLKAVDAALVASRTDEVVTFGLGAGKNADVKAREYAAGYAVPNLFFHTMTAYSILRKEGVEVGKQDYLPHFLNVYLPKELGGTKE